MRLSICTNDILTGTRYESGRKAETTGCDEEILGRGNREGKFTPGNGMKDIYVAGDESTFDHRQIGGHIARVQSLLITRSRY